MKMARLPFMPSGTRGSSRLQRIRRQERGKETSISHASVRIGKKVSHRSLSVDNVKGRILFGLVLMFLCFLQSHLKRNSVQERKNIEASQTKVEVKTIKK